MIDYRLWDKMAPRYDRIVRFFGRSYPEIRVMLGEDLEGSSTALEIAAGTGQFTAAIAGACADVVATDGSEAMVEILAERLSEAGVENVATRVADALNLEFDAGSFDAVVCANVLHLLEHPDVALAEFRRVLKPGGLLAVPTYCHGANLRARLLSSTMSLFSSFVVHHRFDLTTLAGLLGSNSFEVLRSSLLPGPFPIAYIAARRA